MKKLSNILKLMRVKHYLKNILILVPLFFDLKFYFNPYLIKGLLGFISFSILSSIIYIINDMNDLESDKKSEKKKGRPLASGAISLQEALIIVIILFILIISINIFLQWEGAFWLLLYFLLNIAYSIKLKHIPIIDIVILASGFLIRLLYGAAITEIDISFWLCVTVISFSFYMGLGKRRNELINNTQNASEIRGVLKYYNTEFLDKNMYMCLGLAITFYSLWSGAEETIAKLGTDLQMWTIPIVLILSMTYSLDIEKGDSGDPMEVIMNDKILIILAIFYVSIMGIILYL